MARLNLKEHILKRLSAREQFILLSATQLLEGLPADEERYAALFEALCDLSLSDDKAAAYLETVTQHQGRLSERLGRPVDLRVALLDLWSQDEAPVKAAKLIEVEHYLNSLRMAYLDGLTGLYNRRYLEEFLHREITRSERHNLFFSILFVDIDNFKRINDSKGHAFGDRVLKKISEDLKESARREDLVARYGGEEFIVVMPQTDTGGALIFADRLLASVRSRDGDQPTTLSGGIATFPVHGTTAEELLENADKGLYEAKVSGKDRVRVSHSDQRRDPRYRCSLDVLYSFDGTSYNPGITRDVSRSGLGFVTNRSIEVGKNLSLLIRSRRQERTFLVETRIMWAEELPESRETSSIRLGARYYGSEGSSVEELLHEAYGAEPVR
ncbi:MAG: diguanylate cyclase [Spirochaetota bacterium]